MPRPSPWDLDFAESRKAAQKQLGHQLEILRPLIRLSHEFLRECRDVATDDVDLVVAVALRQCLEFADAVDILLRHMSIAPAAAQARGALEHAPQVIWLVNKRDPVLAAAYVSAGILQMEHELRRKQTASGLNEEDRQLFQAEINGIQDMLEHHTRDRFGREALTELRRLRARDPWYAIQGGPKNVHELFAALELAPLSHIYSDLNPIVHGGMPLLAAATASGEPGTENSQEWLRPLRVPAPWAFRPIRATTIAVKIALLHAYFRHFSPRMPNWFARIDSFRVEHDQRCRRAAMPDLFL
ncbi:MAG TPA: DUF5677 domain-containing protein [Longimicrobium sp.]|nr:DUF5677 domain-containing protein [Longimicrobium sp.]